MDTNVYPPVEFEPTISVLEQAKTVHALDGDRLMRHYLAYYVVIAIASAERKY
jgi:hypothetical protein